MVSAPSEPAKLASGTALTPSSEKSASKVIASIAPSDAPAETPSVSGEASGLRSSAWKTTPERARQLPTSAAASTRGRRATKKICASTLSANGIERIEGRREADRRAADERREQARRQRQAAESPRSVTPAAAAGRQDARPSGTTVR